MASRLETLQHRSGGDGSQGGEGRGFRAQIRPDSNTAAEEELRREIRWAVCMQEYVCTRLSFLLHTQQRDVCKDGGYWSGTLAALKVAC